MEDIVGKNVLFQRLMKDVIQNMTKVVKKYETVCNELFNMDKYIGIDIFICRQILRNILYLV